jgi:tRNA-splicing ligase RtcB
MREASGDGKVHEGHFGFHPDSKLGRDYLDDHDWCVQYALENRKAMVAAVVESIQQFLGGNAEWEHLINRSHNHVEKFGEWYIHRKGATHAEFGMKGVIPGNMRDGSFIVRGLGNPDSLMSSSHGAGRLMSRTKAKAELDAEAFVKDMDGIVSDAGVKRLDEAPGAYKDIFEVMEQQKELVETIHVVKPILNVKG